MRRQAIGELHGRPASAQKGWWVPILHWVVGPAVTILVTGQVVRVPAVQLLSGSVALALMTAVVAILMTRQLFRAFSRSHPTLHDAIQQGPLPPAVRSKKSDRVRSLPGATQQGPQSLPVLAEQLLLLVLPVRISDPLMGDLAERFPSIQDRHGDRFARIWYWRHAGGAVCRFLGLRVTGALSITTVARFARRFLSL